MTEAGATLTLQLDPGQSFANEHFVISNAGGASTLTLEAVPASVQITSEGTVASPGPMTLDFAIASANGGMATTGVFANSVAEATPPATITAGAGSALILDGAGFTLSGDGVAGALRVGTNGMTFPATPTSAEVTIENLSITNTGAGAAIANYGAVIIGDDGGGNGPSAIGAAIFGNGAVTIDAGAVAVFGAADTYTGVTTIAGGLELGANGSINDSAGVTLSGSLDVSGAETSTGATTTLILNTLADTGVIALGANTVEITGASTIGGAVTGAGGLQIGPVGGAVAANTTTVSDALAYTGSTKVYGDLALGAGGSLADSSNVSLKATGSTFDITGATPAMGDNVTINKLTGVAGSIVTLGANTLEVTETVTAASFSGVIGGTGGLQVDGPTDGGTVSELTLAGANTYSGATTIEQGAIVGLVGAGTLGAGPTAMTAMAAATTGSALTLEGTLDISQLSAGSFTLGAETGTTGSVATGTNRLIVESATADTLATVTGSGALQVGTAAGAAAATAPATADATSLTLMGASTYSGSTVVYGDLVVNGSISASSNVSLKVAGAAVSLSGAAESGTFFYTSDTSSAGATGVGVGINTLTGVAGATVTLGANALLVDQTVNASFSGVISGTGQVGLVDRGPATLTLEGANSYTGETIVKGHLALGAGGSVADSIGVYDNGVFDVSGATGGGLNIGGLAGDNANASVLLGANTLVINGGYDFGKDGQQDEFIGTISGSGGVTVDGGLVLSGANTYTGATTVNGGLYLASSTLATSSIVDNSYVELYVSGDQTAIAVPAAVISGDGAVYFFAYSDKLGETASPLTATVSTAETYTGDTYVYGADLQITGTGSIANSFV